MNIFQSMNSGAFFLVIVALLNGLKPKIDGLISAPTEILLENKNLFAFIFLYVLLRAKITFDDHKHFRDSNQDHSPYRVSGFLLAILSWIIWAIAGYTATNLQFSSIMLATSLVVSVIWVSIHIAELQNELNKAGNKESILLTASRELSRVLIYPRAKDGKGFGLVIIPFKLANQ